MRTRRKRPAARLWRIGRRDPRPRWLLLDNLITTFGAAFTLIALPFLVMRLSGRALDLGATAAIEALPSLLLLFCFRGALDRIDPARLLWWCRAAYVLINATLAVATWTQAITLPLIYALALIGGLVWAVAYPAGRACFGLYLRRGLLAPANAVFAVASSVAMMAMPMLAGGLILASSGPHALAAAFALDALCVAASLPLLAALRRRGPARGRDPATPAATPMSAADPPPRAARDIPRSYYLYLLASTVLAFGPVQILLPVLLVQRRDPAYLAIYAAQFTGIALAASAAARRVPTEIADTLRGVVLCWIGAACAYALLGAGRRAQGRRAGGGVARLRRARRGLEPLRHPFAVVAAAQRRSAPHGPRDDLVLGRDHGRDAAVLARRRPGGGSPALERRRARAGCARRWLRSRPRRTCCA
ncbi:MFS transporter [Lysobacter enzymogenes]|nr:MFS transporter [Lysobacter enzymogenes]QCW25881.1 MFS transporter [Lysobacter enzymogenes]